MSAAPTVPPDAARGIKKRAAVIGFLALGLKHPKAGARAADLLALEALKEMLADFKRTWGGTCFRRRLAGCRRPMRSAGE